MDLEERCNAQNPLDPFPVASP